MAIRKTGTSTGSSGSNLIIVESPAKIKTISKFLGKDFEIVSTFGHVKDLPAKKVGVEITDQDHIEIDYAPIEGKQKVISEICKKARGKEAIFLASDPDREGEVISYHIGQEIAKVVKDKSKMHRIVFNEITKPAIKAAIENKHNIDMNKVSAQQARRILDRWVGYEVSPILWRKITKGLSAGRVQSVATLLVCQREAEIINFVPEESWSVTGLFTKDKTSFEASLYKIKGKATKLKTKSEADKVLEAAKKASFAIESIADKERLKRPLPPFMTSTLQQDAYNKLGFSVDKTMMIAQKLYEGLPLGDPSSPEALITYMRTDSLRLSDTALKDSREFITKTFSQDYLPAKSAVYSKSKAQDAHEAIRPISIARTPDEINKYLEPNFAKLYELIWRRTVACQMTPAKYAQRQVLVAGDELTFKATGSTLTFDGFLKVYKVEEEDKDKAPKLPAELVKELPLDLQKIGSKQHFTQPPPRYTEASLVKEMEKKGVGRPSTYAATLSTIQKRKYVEKIQKKFSPTELGKTVTEMLVKNLSNIINISFTAGMEEDLDKIAQGSKKRDQVLLDFYKKFQSDLEKFAGKSKTEVKKAVETEIKCPTCKKQNLVIRFGRSGEFLGCPGFPECRFTSGFTKDEEGKIELEAKFEPKTLEITCPQCGKNLVEKKGRYGLFAACPGYPDCKYIHKAGKKKE